MPNAICEYPDCSEQQVLRGYCRKCYKRARRRGMVDVLQPTTIEERFWEKVEVTGFCWNWTGTLSSGYGRFTIAPRPEQKAIGAHRFAYMLLVGPIPQGLHLDHLCRNTRCVNPDHLEPVTPRVNNLRSFSTSAKRARMTHCKNGHEFTESNTRVDKIGRRSCKQCHREYARMRARVLAAAS